MRKHYYKTMIAVTAIFFLIAVGIFASTSATKTSTPSDVGNSLKLFPKEPFSKEVETVEKNLEKLEKEQQALEEKIEELEEKSSKGGNAVFRTGEDIQISKDEVIDGDVVALGGNITVDGKVRGSAVAIGGSVKVSGKVFKDAVAIGGEVHLLPDSYVGKDAVAIGGKVTKEPGARQGRKGSEISLGGKHFAKLLPFFGGALAALAALSFLVVVIVTIIKIFLLILLALLASLLFEKQVKNVTLKAGKEILKSGGAGILTVILFVLGVIALCITIIGIPIAILAVILFAIAIIFGVLCCSYWLGQKILAKLYPKSSSVFVAMALGALILMLIKLIPGLGGLLWILVCLIGLGAVVLTRFGVKAETLPEGPLPTQEESTPTPQ